MSTNYGIEINKKTLLSESQWYNTVLDVLGIVDPTGIIDLINAGSYFRQGDYFFSVLSFLSAVPFADVVTKPVVAAAKVGKGSTASLKYAMSLMKRNPQKAASILASLASKPGVTSTFIKGASKWGPSTIKTLSPLAKKLPLVAKVIEWLEFLLKYPRLTRLSSKAFGVGDDKAKSDTNVDTNLDNGGEIITPQTQTKTPDVDINDPLMSTFVSMFT